MDNTPDPTGFRNEHDEVYACDFSKVRGTKPRLDLAHHPYQLELKLEGLGLRSAIDESW
jgi:hypothetical protein